MKLLDRYLYRLFARNLATVLFALAGLYLLIDFFERIDNFMTHGLPLSLAMRYFLLKLPQIFDQIMPVSLMLAGVATIGLMNHHGELASLQAAGLPSSRVIRPVLVAAFFFSVLSLAASQWLLPATGQATSRIWYEEVNRRPATGINRAGMIFHRGEGGFYLFGPPGDGGRMTPFVYLSLDEGFGFRSLMTAAVASQGADNRWRLENGMRKTRDASGAVRVEPFAEMPVALPETPATIFLPEYHDSFLSLSELSRRAAATEGGDARAAALRLHGRLSYIMLGLPLLMLGLPGLLYLIRQWRRDLSLAIPLSCLAAFAVWGGWGAMQSFAGAGYLPAAPAAWGLHLLVGGVGVWWLRRLA